MEQVFVYCLPMPGVIKGMTRVNHDGDYLVFINANLCEASQKQALEHERRHIMLGHFRNCRSVGEDEVEASTSVKDTPVPQTPRTTRPGVAILPSARRQNKLRLPTVSARERKRMEQLTARLNAEWERNPERMLARLEDRRLFDVG